MGAVAYIFYGRFGQQHLQLQMKVMHTRVMGQFTVLTMVLTLMGFNQYMDHNGKFITETEAQRRVEEMQTKRQELLEQLNRRMALAHEEDVHNHRSSSVVHKKKKRDEAEAAQREKLESHAA